MYFNETKYKKCIGHLIAIKTCIVISYIIIFACIGAGIGYPIMEYLDEDWYVMAIGAGIGAILGLIIGLFSTWRIEMKIQESYWKIDVINELQKQTSIANKNTPVAKTVVAIENKSNPTAGTTQATNNTTSEKKENVKES